MCSQVFRIVLLRLKGPFQKQRMDLIVAGEGWGKISCSPSWSHKDDVMCSDAICLVPTCWGHSDTQSRFMKQASVPGMFGERILLKFI